MCVCVCVCVCVDICVYVCVCVSHTEIVSHDLIVNRCERIRHHGTDGFADEFNGRCVDETWEYVVELEDFAEIVLSSRYDDNSCIIRE